MNREILCWFLLAASVLIFICVIGMGGKLGNAFGDLLFGIFGTCTYVFPFLLFFLTLFMMANRGNTVALIRTLSVIGLFLVFCGILQLANYGDMTGTRVGDYFEVGQEYHAGGGAVGGALVLFFRPTIGLAGTWCVLLIAVFIFGALITQKTLFLSTGRKGSEVYEQQRERRAELRKERKARQKVIRKAREERRRAMRAERERERMLEADEEDLSPVFLSVLEKDGGREKKESHASQFTTDLFGDVKPSKKPVKQETLPPLSPGEVVFKKVPEKTEQKAERFTRIPQNTAAKTDLFGQPLRETETAQAARAQSIRAEDTAAKDPFTLQADAGKLSDTFVIHRAGSAGSDIGESDELPYEEDASLSAPVTAKDIEEAGVSQQRRKESASRKAKEEKPAGDGASDESGKSRMSDAETRKAVEDVASQIEEQEAEEIPYEFPSINFLEKPPRDRGGMTDDELRATAAKLQQILATFGVNAQVTNVSCGPSVTRYELMPELGTKVSKITNLADDIKLNLAAADIRIEAPIPGKAAVGIEVPNEKTDMVYLRELIDSDDFKKHKSRLAYVVGKDIGGRIIVSDIAKMPHLLIAGATGSGKSVFINTLIMSILYNADPNEVKMIMIDPKVVELSVYNGIPHLFIPVVTDPKKAAGALNWGVAEMTRRYQVFAEVGVRNLAGYNAKVDTLIKGGVPDAPKKMPQIVIIVDELADLMMVSGSEVEDAICRLAQLARACGIHLVIATQRPSVDVITGLIKANIPSRIAFAVSSGTDSRTILDMNGAEKLLGNGDMLFSPQTYKKPVRVQGAFVSDEEIQNVVDSIRIDEDASANQELMKKRLQEVQAAGVSTSQGGGGDTDELFAEAGRFIIQKDKASIGMLQRWFKIGFNRAARIMDQLSDAEVVGPDEGTKPRKVLMSAEQFEDYLQQN